MTSWADFMRLAHARPLPLAVFDDLAVPCAECGFAAAEHDADDHEFRKETAT
jgi:hypothetical protein